MRHGKVHVPALDSMRTALIRSAVSAAVILAAVSSTLPAQGLAPAGIRSFSGSHVMSPAPDSGRVGFDPDHGKRVRRAYIGRFTGAVVLGGMWYMTAVAGCGGDDCYGNFVMTIPVVFLGGIAGSVYGAAAPRGRGLCTGGQRFRKGVGGAFLGALVGAIVPPMMLVTIPTGSAMFMKDC